MTGRTQSEKPTPAAGQVWRNRHPSSCATLGRTILRLHTDSDGEPMVEWKEGMNTSVAGLTGDHGWECIGVETPHGRVMVGERRLAPDDGIISGPVTVSHVITGQHVGIADPAGDGALAYYAPIVARWPIVEVASLHDVPMSPLPTPNRFLPVMPTAVPWRERIYTDPLAYALRVQQATDAEAADVFAAEVDRLMRELRRALELTVRPVAIVMPTRPFDPPGKGWSGMYTEER